MVDYDQDMSSSEHMKQFKVLQSVHKIRVEREEKQVAKAKKNLEDAQKVVEEKEKEVQKEEERLDSLFEEMNAYFSKGAVKRQDIEYWRSVIARQRHEIKQAQNRVFEQELYCKELTKELELRKEKLIEVTKRKDKIDYVHKTLSAEHKREQELKEDRDMEDR